jgi:hypothetical protein
LPRCSGLKISQLRRRHRTVTLATFFRPLDFKWSQVRAKLRYASCLNEFFEPIYGKQFMPFRSVYAIRQILSYDTIIKDRISILFLLNDTFKCCTTQFSLISVRLCKYPIWYTYLQNPTDGLVRHNTKNRINPICMLYRMYNITRCHTTQFSLLSVGMCKYHVC